MRDFVLTDGDGGTSAINSTTVTVSALLYQTLEVQVSSTNDDAEEKVSTGIINLNSSDLELVFEGSSEQIAGMRFNGIDIPQGAIITNAYIQFQTDELDSKPTSLEIRGEADDNAQPFASTANNISSRPATIASVAWLPVAWNQVGEASLNQQTPDLSAILQEVVDRDGWVSGNSLVVMVTGTGERTAESYDGVCDDRALRDFNPIEPHSYDLFRRAFENQLREHGYRQPDRGRARHRLRADRWRRRHECDQ